jgi:hypothetical protein
MPDRMPERMRGWWLKGSGLALFSGLLVGLPLNPIHMAQMQALNRELGKLCGNPPAQAISVCRIHARLVQAL